MEAAVVVYLRELYYPEGFGFPMKLIPFDIALTEIGREAMTLLIMAATAAVGFVGLQSRMAAFFMLFGVWDIFYYVFLKLLLDWPQGLCTWDVLFLIPAPWLGPVWAPILTAVLFVIAGASVLLRNGQGAFSYFGKGFVVAETAAALLVVASFLLSGRNVMTTGMPEPFIWPLYAAGLAVGVGAFAYVFFRSRSTSR